MFAAKILTPFLFAVIGHFHTVNAGPCPSDFEEFEGACYALITHQETWDDAKATCHTYGGSLAEPRTANLNNWMTFKMGTKYVNAAWLGGVNFHGKWFWMSDGAPIIDAEWADGEPSNENPNEDCMLISAKDNYKWRDEQCGKLEAFFCHVE